MQTKIVPKERQMLHIGFIDDTPAELPMAKNLEVVPSVLVTGALTLDEFQQTGATPDLFILDVSYVLGEGPNEERVETLLASPPAMLPLTGDRAAVLRNAYGNSMLATKYFADLQDATANHTRGGIRLAQAVYAAYPDTPIVGYSRKTSVTGALVYLATTPACAFFQKPNDPFDWEKTARLTRERAQDLVGAWRRIIGKDKEGREDMRYCSQSAAEHLLSQPGILREQAIREGLQEFLPTLRF